MKPLETFFWDRLAHFGDAPALVTTDGAVITYAELATRADEFARRLPAERQLIGLEAANEIEAVIAYVACLRARHPVILLNENSIQDGRVAANFKPNFLYSKSKGEGWRLDHAAPDAPAFNEDLCILLSTSGTTGSPKLVKLSQTNIDSNARSIAEYLEIDQSHRAVTTLNFAYSYGMSVVNSHFAVGAALLLTPDSIISEKFWDFVKAQNGSSLAFVPHHFELLDQVRFSTMKLPSLKYITQAGGRLAPERVKQFAAIGREMGWRLFVMYGQTEAGPRISYIPPEDIMANADTIGRPIPGGQIVLLDESGAAITQRGVTGELVYKGPNVMIGYAEQRADLSAPRESVDLRTGDMAQINHGGYFKIVGRIKRFVKLYGLRINLDDVEQFLEKRGQQGYCAGTDERLAVFFDTDVNRADIRDLIADKYKIHPDNVFVGQVPEIPRLPNGKVDYKAFAALIEEAPPVEPSVVAAIDGTVRQAFADELAGGAAIKPTDTFVSIGGDSLSYLNLSMFLEKKLGFLPRNWERTPIRDLELLQPQRSGAVGVSMESIIRVLAILSVVTRHSTDWLTVGGAIALLFLAGYSFAKSHTERLANGDVLRTFGMALGRILVVYYLVLTVYFILKPEQVAEHALPWYLLFANFMTLDNSLYAYWFICSYVQIIAAWLVIWAIPPVRKFFATKPLGFGLIIFGAGAVSAAILSHTQDFEHFQYNTLAIGYLFALGWCVYFSNTLTRRLIATAAALATAWYFWGRWGSDHATIHAWVIAATSLALIWIGEIKMPRVLASSVNWISARSFYVYVLHIVPVLFFQKAVVFTGPYAMVETWAATVAIALALGGVMSWLLARAGGWSPLGRRQQAAALG